MSNPIPGKPACPDCGEKIRVFYSERRVSSVEFSDGEFRPDYGDKGFDDLVGECDDPDYVFMCSGEGDCTWMYSVSDPQDSPPPTMKEVTE